MGCLNITQNSNSTIVENRVITIKVPGIQGVQGENGLTPYINETNNHWMIGTVDTGVVAGITSEMIETIKNSVTTIIQLSESEQLPSTPNYNKLYYKNNTVYFAVQSQLAESGFKWKCFSVLDM